MRKALGIILIGIGVFGIAMAVLLPTVVVDKSKKTPLDLDIRQVAAGPAKVLDAASNKVKNVRLRALRNVRTDSTASDSTRTTVVESLCITVDDGKLPKNCVTSSDPRLLNVSTDRVTADRRSGESVHVAKYNEAINGDTGARHKGLSYKFPIDTEKKTYDFFSPDLAKAFPAKYVGTSKIRDLDVYKFVSATGAQPYKVQNLFPGTYDDTRTVWVEPKTGVIVKGTERQVQKLDNGTVALDTTLTFTDGSIDYQANFAKDKIDQLKQAQLWGPLIAGIVGVLAIIGGILLLRRRKGPRDGTGTHRQSEPNPDEPGAEYYQVGAEANAPSYAGGPDYPVNPHEQSPGRQY